MAKVEWRAGDKDIGLLVLEDHSAGQEISNNYGPRNNEQCTYQVCYGWHDIKSLQTSESPERLTIT